MSDPPEDDQDPPDPEPTVVANADALVRRAARGKKLAIAKRLDQAFQLKAKGHGWPVIAARLGCDHRNLLRDVDEYIAATPAESLTLHRAVHNAQLDEQRRTLLELRERAEANEQAALGVDMRAKCQLVQAQIQEKLLKVNESQRKLNGSDAPVKQELTTWVGTVDPVEAARLVREGFPNGARPELHGEVVERHQLPGPSDQAGSEAISEPADE